MDPQTPQRRPGPPHGADRQPPVVVGVDGSAAALRAVEWAAATALSRSAPLRLVYVLPPLDRPQYRPGGSRHRQAVAALDSARRTALRSTAELESTAPLDIVVDIRHGHADRELLELSRSADLIALGTADIGLFAHMVLGSTALAVSRAARCPVALIRRTPAGSGPVLVVVSAWHTARPALRHAFRAAAALRTDVVVARLWQGRSWAAPGYPAPVGAVVSDARIRHCQRDFPTVSVRPITVVGDAVSAVERFSTAARLVVIGNDGTADYPSRLRRIARDLVHHAPCPVLLIPDAPAALPDTSAAAQPRTP
ncbi:universal stress protein [Nocardia otitidiscaviarum]|uniref:universal stress protein n=1 Tax=Nocardia otitidiscaviarum TaxID=1823 RepID=UPI001893DD37|nr:universal stress protein [Nocardia otitidiscaviarum]MBF6182247.1 universal stress protein [Nocardia otitidiscaviarum]